MEGQTAEVTPQVKTDNETSEKKRESLAKRTAHYIKNRAVSYVNNLDPRGKDKIWWTGNLLSAAASAGLFLFAPGARLVKSLTTAGISVGLQVAETAGEKYRDRFWTEEKKAERVAKREKKFPEGTSRLKRFLLGVSAGGIYGAAVGLPLELAHVHPNLTPIKNITRHIDSRLAHA